MAPFDIRKHIEQLKPDGGSSTGGELSFHCPLCDAPNFKVNERTGKWACYGCNCSSTEAGKGKIRAKLSPPINPSRQADPLPYDQGKPLRAKNRRKWLYRDRQGEPLLEVHRTDSGNGARKIWQVSLRDGQTPAELRPLAAPYRLSDALEALESDPSAIVVWVEGEPCADALWGLGIPAVTTLSGCKSFDPSRDAGLIPAARLAIAPDQDQLGLKYAKAVAAAYPGARWLQCFPDDPRWNGACPADGGLDVADWIDQGATRDQILAAIITTPPSPEEEPAGDADGGDAVDARKPDDFMGQARKSFVVLQEGLDRIRELEDDGLRPMALSTLRRELGLNPKEFDSFVNLMMKGDGASFSGRDVMGQQLDNESIIEDLLPAGLTIICGDGHAGKTNLGYQLAEAVSTGGKFSDTFQAVHAHAIVIQLDEPAHMLRKNWKILGLNGENITVHTSWNYYQLHTLRKWVEETGAKLVVIDSFLRACGADAQLKDSTPALMLYELDRFAMQAGISVVLLHHVMKGEKQSPHKAETPNESYQLYKEHMYGSVYFSNSCTDVWMYWPYRDGGKFDPFFALKNVRCRSGIVDIDIIYEFAGSREDHRLYYSGIRGRTSTYSEHRDKTSRVLHYLRSADGRAFTAFQITRALDLGNHRYASDILSRLHTRHADVLKRRVFSPGSVGRPSYAYWSSLGRLDGAFSSDPADTPEAPPEVGAGPAGADNSDGLPSRAMSQKKGKPQDTSVPATDLKSQRGSVRPAGNVLDLLRSPDKADSPETSSDFSGNKSDLYQSLVLPPMNCSDPSEREERERERERKSESREPHAHEGPPPNGAGFDALRRRFNTNRNKPDQ